MRKFYTQRLRKEKNLIVFIFLAFIIGISSYAQTPQAFKYQAVVREANGSVIENTIVSMRISILEGSAIGTVIYSETHQVATNEFGLVNLSIGEGNIVTGNFATINWGSNTFFIKIELDAKGNSNYVFMGTSQLLSVPYALYSETSGSSTTDFDIDSTNELQTITKSGSTVNLSNGGGSFTDDDSQTLILSGTMLSISNGNSVQIGGTVDLDYDPLNEIQNLSLNNDSLKISGSNYVILNDNDSTNEIQYLSINKDTLLISKGNSVKLNDNDSLNELQILSLSNDTISISNGNYIVMPPDVDADTTNEIQSLSLVNDTLSISKGNKIDLDVYLDNTDTQNIKFSNDTLSITNGNSVYIPPPFNFSFPDGTDNIIPITMDSLLLVPYTVPTGYNLYITRFYIGNSYNGSLSIDGIVVFKSDQSTYYSRPLIQPLITGEGSSVKATDNNSSLNGFLIKAKVTPLTLKNIYSTPYIVPQGYTFYITNIYSANLSDGIKIDNTIVTYGRSNYDDSSTYLYIDFGLPIFVKEGQTIKGISASNYVTINGYLK